MFLLEHQMECRIATGHAMTYASISGGRLPSSTAEYVQYGLLTEDEVRRLTPAENKQRDLLITW